MAKQFGYKISYNEGITNPRKGNSIGQLVLYPNQYLEPDVDMNNLPSENGILFRFPLYFHMKEGVPFYLSLGSVSDPNQESNAAGYMIVTYKQLKKFYGERAVGSVRLIEIMEQVKKEIAEINKYISGNYWSYQVFFIEYGITKVVAQGTGFHSYEEAEKEAIEQINYRIDNPIQFVLFELDPKIYRFGEADQKQTKNFKS